MTDTCDRPTFGTVCDGIGCGHLAFAQAGFYCVWSFEIDPFPSAVIAHRFPGVENHGNMNAAIALIESGMIAAPDVLIGGTPCQAFSVGGKRGGMDDARGNLSLTFCRIADTIDAVRRRCGRPPCTILWENVPGVFSDKGNAFGSILGELSGAGCRLQPPRGKWKRAGCVFGPKRTVAWRTLDSQFFGVAQRRKRVFVVASARDDVRPEEILFESEGMRRDIAPSRTTRQEIADDVGSGTARGHWEGGDCHPSLTQSHNTGGIGASNQELFSQHGSGLVPVHSTGDGYWKEGFGTLRARKQDSHETLLCVPHGQGGAEIAKNLSVSLTCNHEAPIEIQDVRNVGKKQNGCGHNDDGVAYTLDAMATHGVAYCAKEVSRQTESNSALAAYENHAQDSRIKQLSEGLVPGINAKSGTGGGNLPLIQSGLSIRRLTPKEYERLQALPDDWTKIPLRGKSDECCPDGPRYKGIGNGQTVTVMQWLAERILRGSDRQYESQT